MIRLIIQYCLIIILMMGCDDRVVPAGEELQEIALKAFIVEDGKAYPLDETRALGGNLASGYVLTGVFTSVDYKVGDNSPNKYPANELDNNRLFWNVPIASNGSYGGGKRYWGMNGVRHTFFAYSAVPVGADASTGVSRMGGLTNAVPVPYINFTQHSDPAKQVDFLVADPVANIKTYLAVPREVNLYFKHALSKLIFKLMGTGRTPLQECQAQVIYKANSVGAYVDAMTIPFPTYLTTGAPWHGGTYNLGSKFTLPASASDSRTAVMFGEMILLPRENLPDEFLTVRISYKDGAGLTKAASIALPSMSLESQKQSIILLNIIETTENLTIASVKLQPWQREDALVDELN